MSILVVVTSIFLLITGAAKISGAKPIADQFEEFGLPKAAMYAVGALEVTSAATLHFDLLRCYTASGLILLMAGAIFSHIRVNHPISSNIPAMAVLLSSVVIAVGSWDIAGDLFSLATSA